VIHRVGVNYVLKEEFQN